MSYRNKTYVAFASEDIKMYRLMEAWRENDNIDFNFFDAHDLFVSLDSSNSETIKRNLRERMKNAKQIVLLGSNFARQKGDKVNTFFGYEVKLLMELNLPVVIANVNGSRKVETSNIPKPLLDSNYFSVSVSFQPTIIKHALEHYTNEFSTTNKVGAHLYNENTYKILGL